MKNKLKKTMTALCAALILMGGFSVPAYAQGAATEPPAGDATNDSNVVVEEKEETPPLTPKGNATLVDDYGGNKQLITVTTKGGNYFYILIDRAAEGEQTVHFLNQVDEADLMALTENGEAAKKPEICNCTEKCEVGKVNTSCPVCVTSMTGCTGKEPTPTPTEQPEELKEKGIWFVCADMGGETMYDLDLTGPMGLVIGNEGEGVSRLVREACDFTASIPMKGDIDSLNASVAAGVLAYEIVRQRLAKAGK